MFLRDSAEYKNAQKIFIEKLVNEAKSGITRVDILPNMAQPLQGEVEAMYFNAIRNFFENSISHKVMKIHQDKYEEK